MIKGMYNNKRGNTEYFLITEENNECIDFIVVDQNGKYIDGGLLFSFHKVLGRITLYPDVNEVFGFDLNGDGSLIVEE